MMLHKVFGNFVALDCVLKLLLAFFCDLTYGHLCFYSFQSPRGPMVNGGPWGTHRGFWPKMAQNGQNMAKNGQK